MTDPKMLEADDVQRWLDSEPIGHFVRGGRFQWRMAAATFASEQVRERTRVLAKDEIIDRQGDKIDEQALQLAALEKRIAKADELIVALLYHRKHGEKASHKRVFELVNEYEAIRREFGLADGREEKNG